MLPDPFSRAFRGLGHETMVYVHQDKMLYLSFVRESLRTGSQGEVIKMKKAVVKQIKEMTDNFKPDVLPPCELANVKFIASPELTQACQECVVMGPCCTPSLNNFIRGVLMELILLVKALRISPCMYWLNVVVCPGDSIKPHP